MRESAIPAGIISRLYRRRGVDHLRAVDKEDFSEGYSDRANNATPRNRIPWRELFPRSVANRSAHRDSWQALLMRMNDEMARRGLAVSLVVVWSRAVDELALRRPCAPYPPLEAPLRHPSGLPIPPPIPPQNPPHPASLVPLFPVLFLAHPFRDRRYYIYSSLPL